MSSTISGRVATATPEPRPVPAATTPVHRRESARSPGPVLHALLAVLVVAVAAVLVAALWWRAEGGRWFTVETPSMGTALPVGTLVLTTPTRVADLVVGDVVTFHSPESRTVYTHRVQALADDRVTTRGDVNDASDSGTIGQADLVGRVAWQVPALGWVLRAVPVLVAGGVVTWLASLGVRTVRRRGVRVVGASLTLAVANLLVHPWVGIQRISERLPDDGRAGLLLDVVSTGLLPVRAEQVGGGASATLRDGEVVTLHLAPRRNGSYEVVSALDLGWWGWVLVVLACLTPLLLSLLLGPSRPSPSEPVAALPRQRFDRLEDLLR